MRLKQCIFALVAMLLCAFSANAQGGVVAKIGETSYATLEEAIAAAESGATITLMNGEYELPGFSNKELTFVGESKEGVIVNDAPNANVQGWNGSTFHFENLTAKGINANYYGLANGVVAVTYKDCILNNQRFLYAKKVTFEDCVFNQTSSDWYNVWTYSAENVSFTRCTFNCAGKSVLVYHDTPPAGTDGISTNLTVTECAFVATNTIAGKAAIEIDTSTMAGATITVDGATTVNDTFGGGSVSGNTLWNNKKGSEGVNNDITVVVDNVTVLKPVTAVAKIGEQGYETLAAALAAAQDGDVVTLVWADGDAPIAMNGAVFGKSVTITGTATVDWSKDWFFVGRGGEGNGTVTFDGANLTSASANDNSGLGIHVSGREKNTDKKYDGTLVIKNSTIELDYLINRGAIELGEGAILTVKNGFGIAGRPASETESGEAATATVTLNSGSKLVVNNHNGMGVGQAATAPEGYGVMNVNAGAAFETTQAFLVTSNGTMNVAAGGAVNVNGTLTVNGTLVSAGDIAATIAAGDNATIEISGGVYTQDVNDWCVDSYAALQNLDGKYVVGVKPTATIENLGSMLVKAGDYFVKNLQGSGDNSKDMPLQFVMKYTADQTAEDVAKSPYKDWYADFVLSFTGLADDSFVADEDTYLAGFYGETEKWEGIWAKVGITGMEITEGTRYPVMMGVGMPQNYEYICAGVEEFLCAMNISSEILAANPDLKVTLELCVVDNSNDELALNALQTGGDKCNVAAVKNFVADDFEKVELPEVVITDIKDSLKDSDPDLTFALNFAIKDVENLDEEYLEKLFAQYGSWYTDYVLTISGLTDENVTFNANGGGDGYLAGQYDAWSENWVSVPFEDVTLADGESIYIMEYAAKLMNKQGLRFTLAEVAEIVQNFDCGVYFTPEFLAANPGMKVDLQLKVFTEDAEGNKVNDINVATNNFDVEDYVAIVHADGKQTKYCTTLADAVAAATDGATVTMLSNVELTEAVNVVGKAITLDLNGKTVSGACNSNQGHLIYIENGAGLIVKDGAANGGGKLTYAQGTSNVGWTVAVMGNLTLESGTIELTGEWSIGYAVDVRPNAWGVAYTAPSVFIMNGGNVVSSDGAVRVASSSSDKYADVSASFVMNDGKIDAAWDGVFIQQSNDAYDVLNFTINGGTIESDLNPVRVYGPAPTSYVNGQECMSINFNGGTMTYTGTEERTWVIDGVLRVGGGSSIETIVENGNITAGEAFAQAQALPESYIWEQDGETYKVVEAPKAPEVVDGKIEFVDGEFDSYTNDADIENVEITYKRTIDSDWNALYVPFAIPASELLDNFDIAYINDVRETDADDDGELDNWQMELIKIKKETATLKANHPYFIRSKSADAGENNLNITLTTTLCKATVTELTCSSMYSTYTVKGLNELRASTEFGEADRVLGYNNGETTWGKMADGYSLKPFRFYLTIEGGVDMYSNAQMSIVVRGEDGTTGIDGIYGDENSEAVIFDLYGRRVLEPQKGCIYIVNGKKLIY